MGITIHWRLKFKGSKRDVIAKLTAVGQIAKELEFDTVLPIWEHDFSKDYNDEAENKLKAGKEADSYRWQKIQAAPPFEEFEEDDRKGYRQPEDSKKYWGFGICCWTGAGCEPSNICLITKDGLNWRGRSFTKTQYAESFVTAHLKVVTLLDGIKRLGLLESVHDEAEYWEKRDLSVLAENINKSTDMIKAMRGMLEKSFKSMEIESPIKECQNYVRVKDSPVKCQKKTVNRLKKNSER